VIAANTLLRSFAGGAFPLFATQMFNNLGIQWAGTLLGCLAAIMIPIPIAFYIYGPKLRKKSKFAPTEPESSLSDEESGNGAEDGER
jgi:DHA1 family multidrug resistance protein-like MFS transporter